MHSRIFKLGIERVSDKRMSEGVRRGWDIRDGGSV